MPVPVPTPILRFIHIRNLHIYLERRGIHAPNTEPEDGHQYQPNHNEEVQAKRHLKQISCGPGGRVHDYVPFYFGYLSPMMLNLKTGRVSGYTDGQHPLIYLVSSCQTVDNAGVRFVFSEGHGIANWTEWFDQLADLDKIDWKTVYERYWTDTIDDPDRQRRKQAEFLVHEFCDWDLIEQIVVIDAAMKLAVEKVLGAYDRKLQRPVVIKRDWYYW